MKIMEGSYRTPVVSGRVSGSEERSNAMQCPVCQVDLMIADRQGIEIDYCPKCRGVWLDRGELDKLIERSAAMFTQQPKEEPPPSYAPAPPPQYTQQAPPPQYNQAPQHHAGHDDRGHHGHQKRKRKSFLQEMFDFD